MKKYFIPVLILCMALAFSACGNDEPEDIIPPEGEGSPVLPEDTENLLDFTIEFDENDRTLYGSMTEEVVTDPGDGNYDDFIENSSFPLRVTIAYEGESVSVDNAVEGVTITREGAHIVVNSTQAGVEYVLTGATDNGSFKVYGDNRFRLSLAGVSILNPVGAAINIQSSGRVFVVCPEGTVNSLIDGTSYMMTEGEDMKACLFSEGQLIFSGTGVLTVTGRYNHAITSDDYVRFRTGCNITVPSAENDGIHTNDAVIIGGGTLDIASSGDAIQCGNGGITMTGGFVKTSTTGEKSHGLKAELDIHITGGAIHAEVTGAGSKGLSVDGNLTVEDGKLTLLTSGDALYEEDEDDLSSSAGIKCDENVHILGGEISIQSTGRAGKGINCDGTLTISDGTVKVITTGEQHVYNQLDSSAKGIRVEGNLAIDGGMVLARTTGGEGSEGIESKSTLTVRGGTVAALCHDDCINATDAIEIHGGNIYCYSSANDGIDSNGTLAVSGGLVVSIGAGSPEGGFDCDRSTFAITGGTLLGIGGTTSTPTASACTQRSIVYGASGYSGQYVNIRSASSGTSLFIYQIPRDYSRMRLLFSSPGLVADGDYVLSIGGTVSGGSGFFGFYPDATYSGGTDRETFTAGSMVTSIGDTSGGWW